MSGYESDTCGRSYTIRIRYVWTQIFLYPHKKKFADTKISGYVWTGPKKIPLNKEKGKLIHSYAMAIFYLGQTTFKRISLVECPCAIKLNAFS